MPYGKRGAEWPCNCVLCRVLVKPFSRRKEEVEGLEAKEVPIEGVESGIEEVQQQPINVDKIVESVAQSVTQLVETKMRDFVSRIDGVEEEVKRVKEEMVKNIEDLRNALVDLRAAIAEVSNPFNVLRVYSHRSAVKEPPKVNQIIENFEKALKNVTKQSSEMLGNQGGETVSMENMGIPKDVVAKGFRKLGLAGLIKLVKWVDDMLNRVPKEVIEEIAKFMKAINAVDEEEEKIVLNVIDFVFKARKIGLKMNEQVIYIYNLAKIFGVTDEEANEEILRLAMNSGIG